MTFSLLDAHFLGVPCARCHLEPDGPGAVLAQFASDSRAATLEVHGLQCGLA